MYVKVSIKNASFGLSRETYNKPSTQEQDTDRSEAPRRHLYKSGESITENKKQQ